MTTLVITTNASQGSDVTIGDMGITIAASGGSETFTDARNILRAELSNNLRTLTTDDAHGAGSSTLILNDGTNNIDQADTGTFLGQVSQNIISDTAEATGDITTTSTSPILATSMTITPASGTYLAWFSGSGNVGTKNANYTTSVYVGGVQQATSICTSFMGGASHDEAFISIAKITVDGTQAIEGRWQVSSGTGTLHQRCLLILRVS